MQAWHNDAVYMYVHAHAHAHMHNLVEDVKLDHGVLSLHPAEECPHRPYEYVDKMRWSLKRTRVTTTEACLARAHTATATAVLYCRSVRFLRSIETAQWNWPKFRSARKLRISLIRTRVQLYYNIICYTDEVPRNAHRRLLLLPCSASGGRKYCKGAERSAQSIWVDYVLGGGSADDLASAYTVDPSAPPLA